MNITLTISSLGAGGAEKVLSALANYLTKKHQVTIVTLAANTSKPFYFLHSSINLIQLDQTDEDRGGFLGRITNIIKRLISLRKAIKNSRPDGVISFVDVMNITTLIATLGLKIPIVISERIDPHFHEIPSFYKWLRLRFYPLCSQLVVQIQSSANYFPKSFQKFISIIANPVSRPEIQKSIYSKRIKNLICVGRLDNQKDHVTLIKAFARVTTQYPGLTLTIYGEGAGRKKLENLISELKLHKTVHLPGITQNIQNALINADLFVFPSLYEGFPNALCEAMAIGLPIIASNCTGNVDVIEDYVNGKLFPVGDHESLTKIIIDYLKDPEKLVGLSQKGKEICKTYDPDKIFSKWEKIIESSAKL